MKNYFNEIDKALKYHENGLYHTHSLLWIANRIDWCYKWKHITKEQMESFCDRVNILLECCDE